MVKVRRNPRRRRRTGGWILEAVHRKTKRASRLGDQKFKTRAAAARKARKIVRGLKADYDIRVRRL